MKEKLIISTQYLQLLSENSKKKKSLKKPLSLPSWFNIVSKTIIKHKFAINEFRIFLTEIFINSDYILP